MLFAGEPVIAAPKVVPVIFPGNALDAQIRQFFTSLETSSWWAETTAEYGVGAITTLPVYVPTDPLPTLATVDQWIADLAASAPAGLPAPDNNTIYAIVLPEGWQQAEGACVTFGAYHGVNNTASGQPVVHTVNPTCAVPYLGLTGINQISVALSHEIEESATDPEEASYIGTNWMASGWATAGEGSTFAETADMCEFQPEVFYTDPGSGFLVQRIWSNTPPSPGATIRASRSSLARGRTSPPRRSRRTGRRPMRSGIRAAFRSTPGRKSRFRSSFGRTVRRSDWRLSAEEQPNPHLLPDVYNELSFSWDSPTGHAGETRYLTITRAPPPDGGTPVFLRVAINSTLGSVTHTSWLVVGAEQAQPQSTNPAQWL